MARVAIGTALLVIGASALNPLGACGDKYLNLGLGTHYNRSAAERRAAGILIYADPQSELSKMLTTLSIADGMKKVGYQPTFASSSDQLDAALRARSWDVIVVDVARADDVVRRLPKTAAAPRLLPVLTKPTRDELKRAEKVYDVVLNTPSKNRAFVDGVDDAMDLHDFDIAEAARSAKRSSR